MPAENRSGSEEAYSTGRIVAMNALSRGVRMGVLVVLGSCCLTACKETPPAEPTRNVAISEPMYALATCRLKDDQLVWCERGASKDHAVRATRKSTVEYLSSESDAATAAVYLHTFLPGAADAPPAEISFFETRCSVKGDLDKRVMLPDTCVFWLQKADGYYLITNIQPP
jgi:hypothetical protein